MSYLHEVEELAGFGVWSWKLAENELEWSSGMRRVLGVAEVTPTFEQWLAHVHADDQSTVKSYFTRLRRDHGTCAIEYRIVGGDGEVRTIESRARATAIEVVGIDQDVTQRKETVARVAFSDRMVAIGTLAGGAAHEINNPLAIISANLQLLEERTDPALVREAAQAVERIRTIVKGLTAFSRSTGDPRAAVDVQRVLDLALAFTGNQLRQRARVIANIEPMPWVSADEGRLGQCFINLLVNAAEAIPEGNANQHQIRVTALTDAAGWAIIEISDSGAGIAPNVAARVFEPFFTTKPVGHGTGLGLSICHGIVRAAGGDITFRTSKTGTTFSIALPPGRPPTPAPQAIANEPKPTRRRGTVLVIDDEVMFANSLRRVLSNEHDVTVMNSGREAFAAIREGAGFDVILCDLMMPEMTGAELHAALAGLDPALADRIVFITGGAFSPASQAFLDRVTNVCFEKPCDLGRLRTAIRALVDSR